MWCAGIQYPLILSTYPSEEAHFAFLKSFFSHLTLLNHSANLFDLDDNCYFTSPVQWNLY